MLEKQKLVQAVPRNRFMTTKIKQYNKTTTTMKRNVQQTKAVNNPEAITCSDSGGYPTIF